MRVSQTTTNPAQSTDVSKTQKSGRAALVEKGKKASEKAGAAATTAANTEISSRGKEAARVKEVALKAPDVREEKIAELKKRIAAGKYNIDENAIADKMVNEHLQTKDLG